MHTEFEQLYKNCAGDEEPELSAQVLKKVCTVDQLSILH